MGRGGWWVVSVSGKGVQKPDRLVLIEKSNTFINMNISSCLYQCYCLSSLKIRYCFIFLQKCKSVLYFLHLLD